MLLEWKKLKLHLDGYEDEETSKRSIKNSEKLMNIAYACHVWL